ncbi:hypothetical protein RUM43_005409 [Polyplax serrata]|uniref:Uncharacterized protein n=1 Tax=Polyplax serrata TaxID=468196 RepID=A0AAN8S1G3_POLSC
MDVLMDSFTGHGLLGLTTSQCAGFRVATSRCMKNKLRLFPTATPTCAKTTTQNYISKLWLDCD